ncbi:GDP-mannose 4,6 dehydratase [Cryobacterium zongtaii]|uniref:GDP-mannose 4,6-dehydratase n=1 Tax=Cryobacterium zongtaii TaxID=1259217 RepID=A0A2S3ZM83_9MICO|nr:GDP-mannose 4,6-dehydratase [Cryobacterium zongtaii]POH69710.1 GDP-mannose 4,6 dehydratase [Cryobacterium zongtaii]
MNDSTPKQRVLITGANGQDGGYLVRRLVSEGHEVHGMCHSASGASLLADDVPEAIAHVCDLGDADGIESLVNAVEPTHIFNLAGNTSVARSWDFPAETADVLGAGPIRLLQAAWMFGERSSRPVRFVQASSAEIFGDATEVPQSETTLREPATPYGAAKSFAHDMVGVYRHRGMFASSAILYNHESPRRPETFVARKISQEVARISLGLSDRLALGNIDVHRDWGYAPDYVDAMIRISRADSASDFIVATGVSHSVRDFVDAAFAYIGVDDWSRYVVIDPAFYRPADPKELVGDPTRLKALGWEPSVDFTDLVTLMVQADLDALQAD